jgi:hypothetical protein
MGLIEDRFNQYCKTDLDINEHFPTLKKYALECESITEMGVRSIVSTWAFLAGKPKKMISIDIYHPSYYRGNLDEVENECKKEGIDFKFIQASTLDIDIEETDLLFIDTLHTYEHVKKELFLHGNKTKKYLVFHDTTSSPEIVPAIEEFMKTNPSWSIKDRYENNNGLIILENRHDKTV